MGSNGIPHIPIGAFLSRAKLGTLIDLFFYQIALRPHISLTHSAVENPPISLYASP